MSFKKAFRGLITKNIMLFEFLKSVSGLNIALLNDDLKTKADIFQHCLKTFFGHFIEFIHYFQEIRYTRTYLTYLILYKKSK